MGQLLKDWKRNKERPYPLTMADGSPVAHDDGWINTELHNIQLNISGHEENMTLEKVEIKYDSVLVMAWLSQHNPTIAWKARVLEFSNCSPGRMGDRSSLSVPIARAIWVRP